MPDHFDTLGLFIGLSVQGDQRDRVSANMKTLAEAPCEPGAVVWGLWDGEVPVGLMAMIGPAGVRLPGPSLCQGAACL